MRKFLLTRRVLHLALAVMLLTFSLPRTVFPQASTTTTNEFLPFSRSSFVHCANGGAGETVLVSGITHVLTHMTVNRNRMIFKFHFQAQGATGLGLVTGVVYRAVGGNQLIISLPLSHGASTSTSINTFTLIGPGLNNNLQAHQNLHVTFNATGEVTTIVENTIVDCK